MTEQRTIEQRFVPLRCRLFGHKWKAHHKLEKIQPYGLLGWVYLEDVCERCYTAQFRMGDWAEGHDEYNLRRVGNV